MLRNQSCGTRWRSAASGPRFVAVIATWTSSTSALGVFHRHVEEARPLEQAGLLDLVFGNLAAALQALAHEVFVGVGPLRITVEELQVGVARDRVEVVVDLLHVLAVVALLVGEAEQTLLQDAVAPVPQGQTDAELAALVTDAGQAVLAPPIGARAGLLVGERAPRVAVAAVILAHGGPIAARSNTAPTATTPARRAPARRCGAAPPKRSPRSCAGPAAEDRRGRGWGRAGERSWHPEGPKGRRLVRCIISATPRRRGYFLKLQTHRAGGAALVPPRLQEEGAGAMSSNASPDFSRLFCQIAATPGSDRTKTAVSLGRTCAASTSDLRNLERSLGVQGASTPSLLPRLRPRSRPSRIHRCSSRPASPSPSTPSARPR